MKRKIPPLEQTAFDRGPFGKDDRLGVRPDCFESQRVAPDDISFQDKYNGIAAFVFGFFAVKTAVGPIKNAKQAFAALDDVVLQYIDPVDARKGKDGIPLVLHLAPSIPLLNDSQFPFEYLGKEIPSAAGGLQKAGFNPFRFLPDQIQHGVDFPLTGIHLAMICHALLRDKLGFHLFGCINRREVVLVHFLRFVALITLNRIVFRFHQRCVLSEEFEASFRDPLLTVS